MERKAAEQRAVERALARGGAQAVREGPFAGTYRVLSNTRDGLLHTVSVDGGVYRCDCESGLSRRPCWHAASVYMYRLEAAGLRVSGAPSPQAAPARRPRQQVALT